MIFIENKYYRTYTKIIENAKNRLIDGYYETHHIVPKSLGGDNSVENLVKLTAREHFVCHLLLPKFTTGESKYKMLHAFIMMSGREVYKSRSYEIFRKDYSLYMKKKMAGEKNPMYGSDRKGTKNTFYGKAHTDETKRKISEKKIGHSYNKGIPKSEEHKKKLSKSRTGSGKVYVFEHTSGRVFKGSAPQLSKLVGSHPAEAWKLVVGKYKTHKGWKLKE